MLKPRPTQIYIDDSGHVHVSYQCDVCSEWVHTDDHCGDTKPDGTDEFMCSDCYGKEVRKVLQREAVDATIPELSEGMCTTFLEESGFKVEKIKGFDREGCTCTDCEAFRPRVDGTVIDGLWVCSDCAHDRVNKMYIHDWLIFIVDFDQGNYCGEYRIAIHKDVVNPSKASHFLADCSSPDPDKGITRYGPGRFATALDCIESMHVTINDVYTLVDEGYIRSDNAHLIFQAQGGAS